MNHIDVVITEQCSMKCRDCANLMQFYSRPKNSDTNLLFKSMDRLMECVDHLNEFRVIGGDPFMNKEIYKINSKYIKQHIYIYILKLLRCCFKYNKSVF